MDKTSTVTALILIGIVIILILSSRLSKSDCENRISYANINLNQGINLDSLFSPATTAELAGIRREWIAMDMHSDSSSVMQTFNYYGRKVQIIGHTAETRQHYGAFIYPLNYDSIASYPLLVWASGLDQRNPRVVLQGDNAIKALISSLDEHFILVPSFRGQALVLNQSNYCSDGFFGDAFDGATDDALRLLHLAKMNIPTIDLENITVCGVSRGGTVALLMGARDTTIRNLVAIAGPTDFLLEEVYDRYSNQYKYQFLSTTTDMPEIRKKIIESSPVHFIQDYRQSLLLIQGRNDEVVPLYNAQTVIAKMKEHDQFEAVINDGGHAFYGWDQVINWIVDHS